MVATIGPMELSVKQDKQMDKELTVNSARNATANPPKYRQFTSASCKITNPSEFNTIISPVPKSNFPTTTDITPIHKMTIKV